MTTDRAKEEVKVPAVVCRDTMQAIGDLSIPAPPGIIFDMKCGQLKQKVTIELAGSPQMRSVTIIPGTAISQGVVPVQLLVDGRVIIPLLEIPIQFVMPCPGGLPGDMLQLHDLQVEGFSLSPVRLLAADWCTLKLHLILKVVVQACIIVSRETILRVEAVHPFC